MDTARLYPIKKIRGNLPYCILNPISTFFPPQRQATCVRVLGRGALRAAVLVRVTLHLVD